MDQAAFALVLAPNLRVIAALRSNLLRSVGLRLLLRVVRHFQRELDAFATHHAVQRVSRVLAHVHRLAGPRDRVLALVVHVVDVLLLQIGHARGDLQRVRHADDRQPVFDAFQIQIANIPRLRTVQVMRPQKELELLDVLVAHRELLVLLHALLVRVFKLGVLRYWHVDHHDIARNRDFPARVGQHEALLHHVVEVLLDVRPVIGARMERAAHDHVHVQPADHHHVVVHRLLSRARFLGENDEDREVEHLLVDVEQLQDVRVATTNDRRRVFEYDEQRIAGGQERRERRLRSVLGRF